MSVIEEYISAGIRKSSWEIRRKPSSYDESYFLATKKHTSYGGGVMVISSPDHRKLESSKLIMYGAEYLHSAPYQKVYVNLVDEESIYVSSELNQIISIVEKSKCILDLPGNWDEEGAEPYSKEVWLKAVKFLLKHGEWVLEHTGKAILVPKILHGPEGSIDIYWKKPEFYLLMNIPKDDNSLATFYISDYKELKIEGQFNPKETSHYLLPPLI